MERYYTTIEQSMHLMDYKLNPQTADMSYNKVVYEPNQTKYVLGLNSPKKDDYPCWSVGALIDLIPKQIKVNSKIHSLSILTMPHTYSISHTDSKFETTIGVQIIGKSLIDVVYQYVIWLREHEII